jgi:hypothetical protein
VIERYFELEALVMPFSVFRPLRGGGREYLHDL